jgi:hypothetical protein
MSPLAEDLGVNQSGTTVANDVGFSPVGQLVGAGAMSKIYVTKSRCTAGLQCLRRL